MPSSVLADKLLCENLSYTTIHTEYSLQTQQCACLVAGFKSKIKHYTRQELVSLRNQMIAKHAIYVTIANGILFKDYLYQDYLHHLDKQLRKSN